MIQMKRGIDTATVDTMRTIMGGGLMTGTLDMKVEQGEMNMKNEGKMGRVLMMTGEKTKRDRRE